MDPCGDRSGSPVLRFINIKDYFWYKEGLSFTIDDEKKPGLYKRIRKVMDAGDSMWGLIAATVVLAAGVSLVEFACTAGFPVLWTNLLVSQGVTAGTFVLLLLVYMLIYQLDELGIFFVAVFTLRSSKMEEKHGRILKLIGGMLMLTLAVVMLVDPEHHELAVDLVDRIRHRFCRHYCGAAAAPVGAARGWHPPGVRIQARSKKATFQEKSLKCHQREEKDSSESRSNLSAGSDRWRSWASC
jgi:hypothetical protein